MCLGIQESTGDAAPDAVQEEATDSPVLQSRSEEDTVSHFAGFQTLSSFFAVYFAEATSRAA
jgi:hypothetical protein